MTEHPALAAAIAKALDKYAGLKPLLCVTDLAATVQAYMDCALWSSTDEEGLPLDQSPRGKNYNRKAYNVDDLTPATVNEMTDDVIGFIAANADDACTWLEDEGPDALGYDFWLTRNRHGAGFWDRGAGELGQRLTQAAHPYGSVYLYPCGPNNEQIEAS